MQFNIDFEISSLVILSILIIYFFIKRQHVQERSKIYALYLLLIFFDIVLDILTVLSSYYSHIIPHSIDYLLNWSYQFLQIILPVIFLTYIITLTRFHYKKIIWIFYLPTFITLAFLFTNPWSHAIFYYDAMNVYTQGNWQILLYINGAFCMLAGLVISIFYKKKMDKYLFVTILSITLITVIGLLIQFFHRELLMTGIGLVMSLLILYFSFENPDYFTDALTNTMNRNAFISELNNMYLLMNEFHLLVISIDDFKSVNDIFGVDSGDMLLKNVAQYLKTVTPHQKLYRTNGDIFTLIIPKTQLTEKILKNIQDRFQEPWFINHMNIHLNISICLLYSKLYPQDPTQLIKMIDYAIIESKKREHGHLIRVDEAVNMALKRKTEIEKAIHLAIENKTLEMHYQPIYSPIEQTYTSLEALARLHIPAYGYIPPDEFIHYAESNGSIIDLGYLIMNEVFDFMKHYQFQDIQKVSINLSAIQCMQETFADDVIQLCQQKNVNPKLLCFELTETASILEQNICIENMKKLVDFGICFSLDDYGTGYSSMQYILSLPFQIIKIDKTLLNTALTNDKSQIILTTTLSMFQKLNYHIVVEGVETQAQAHFLSNLQVDSLQGYYYSKPLPANELIHFIKNHT